MVNTEQNFFGKRKSPKENMYQNKGDAAEEMLEHFVSNEGTRKFTPENYKNLKIDHKFGQRWNFGNLGGLDDFYYFAESSQGHPNLINAFYNKAVELNPLLREISAKTDLDKIHVIRGLGSGLHFNDVKYFVEKINGSAKNQKIRDKVIKNLAYSLYDYRNPLKVQDKEREANSVCGIDFVLSPKTALRVAFNVPYNPRRCY